MSQQETPPIRVDDFRQDLADIIEAVRSKTCALEVAEADGALLIDLSRPGIECRRRIRLRVVVDSSRVGTIELIRPLGNRKERRFGAKFQFWWR